jgi:phosphatidylinositol glycan class B
LLLLGGGLLSLCLGILIDAWFYQELVLTSWNYFYINIVENYASGFGVYPWYFFIWAIAKYPFYPLGIGVLLAILVLLLRQWRNWIVWVVLPFVIVQSIIPHKEMRFIFPVANLVPLMLIYAMQAIKDTRFVTKHISYFRYAALCLLVPFIIINTAGLLAMAFKSAVNGRREITRFIHSAYRDQPICLLYAPGANPYNPWPQIRENFYLEEQLREVNLELLTDFDIKSINNKGVGLLVIRKRDQASPKYKEIIKMLGFKEQLQGFPAWIAWIGNFYDSRGNEDMLVLYTTRFNALK